MKTKLAAFRILLILFVILYIFALLFYLLITFTGEHTVPKELHRISVFGNTIKPRFYSYLVVSTILDVLLIYSLAQVLKITDYFKIHTYFTPKVIDLLKATGKSFVLIAIIGFLASTFFHYSFSENFIESMLLPFFYHFMILIIGFGFLVIEELQKHALLIKDENDLTI